MKRIQGLIEKYGALIEKAREEIKTLPFAKALSRMDKVAILEEVISDLTSILSHPDSYSGKYTFQEPKLLNGDDVWFLNRAGKGCRGKIISIVTHWGKDGSARHIYAIARDGRKRLIHVDEKAIMYKF